MTSHSSLAELSAPTTVTNPAAPVGQQERIEIVDVLRGFALFGILCINILAFANPGSPPGFQFQGAWWDGLIYSSVIVLVESKFFTLFSALFGLGFAIQLLRAQTRGENIVPRFRRRLLALGAFGALHIVFLWDGDILLLYALVGFLLLLFRNMSPERLLAWIRGLLIVPIVLYGVGWIGLEVARFIPESAASLRAADTEFAASFANEAARIAREYATGDYGAVLVDRVEGYATTFILLLTRVPTVLAMFLLGLYVGRIGVIQNPGAHLPLLRRVRFWAWSMGLPLSVLIALGYAFLPPISAIVTLLFNQALAGALLSVAYASSLILTVQHAKQTPFWTRPLANVGRMALTNYLLQSLICTLIFNGYGLGLAGQLAPGLVLLIALGIYAAQMGWSTVWLRFNRFGPMEWLWRCLTYGRWQPMRPEPGASNKLEVQS
jgi:uncharacterized protein